MITSVIGATGLVGKMFLRILEARNYPVSELHLYATENSVDKSITFKGREYQVVPLSFSTVKRCDLSLFSAGADTAKTFAGEFVKTGALVVDNSSAFRQDPEIPLVVPEVNAQEIKRNTGIIANPNCSTIGMVAVLNPLHREFGLKEVVVTSFQSVSGAGQKALDELRYEYNNPEFDPKIFYGRRIFNNCIPQIGNFNQNGETFEEFKFRGESRKIMNIPDLKVSATAVRVPVEVGHSLAIHAKFRENINRKSAMRILQSVPCVKVFENDDNFPVAADAAGSDNVLVGRIREVDGFENTLNLWVVIDNIRKGAATNAVQIAEIALLNRKQVAKNV